MLIGVVALIVIGPEDLPKLFRTLGRITARARSMSREFTSAMEDAAKSSGLEEAANTLKDVNSLTSKKALGLDALDRAAERFEKWDPMNPKTDDAKGSLKPAAPKPAAPASAGSDGQADAVTPPAPAGAPPASAASSTPASQTPAPAAVPLATEVTPPAAEAPGKRRLHAVRRSDSGTEMKGD
ncbi:Sec-independent protein translocase subunit TatA/TatB [Paracoccus cavernae]|uniref:Sec-independent protein translocase subunit TatA/TatB n=1 Tax=Paracoccus cavernae TaxID=1571207 RepID=UPI0035F49F4C